MEIATVLVWFVGNQVDALVFLFLVVMNGVITFHNEHDSQKALGLLKKKLTIKTNVLRGGKWSLLEARNLIPGDIITLRIGDIVPADAKIITGQISADQAALTRISS